MIDILFFYFLLASLFVFGKKVGMYFSPFQLTAARLLIMGVIFLSYSLLMGQVKLKQVLKHKFIFFGFIISALCADLFRFMSLTVLPASHSALISTTSPFIAAILSYLVFKEYISWQKACALALGAIGIMPLMYNNMVALPVSTTHILIKGYGSALISTIAFITNGLCIKKLGMYGYKLLAILGVSLTIAGFMTGCIGLCIQPHFFDAYFSYFDSLPLVILPSLVAYPLYGYLVCAYPLTLVAFAQLSSPIWAALILWHNGHNELSLPFIFSFCLLTIAFALFYHHERKDKKNMQQHQAQQQVADK